MKILWLSNKVQSDSDRSGTGTWQDAMAQAIVRSGQVKLSNLAIGGAFHQTLRQDAGAITQWIIPAAAHLRLHKGLPNAAVVADICRLVEEVEPDLVHIWGTETFLGLLSARGQIMRPTLLEMQGVKSAIANVYSGGLNWKEQLACIGVKEILRRNMIFQGRRRFTAWTVYEHEIIAGQRFITIQSPWLEAQIRAVNSWCEVFYNEFTLRQAFYSAKPWVPIEQPVVFCSASYPSPFKGVHVAVRALAILKRRFPDVQLRISGALQRSGLRQEGYIAWVNREARRLGVEQNLSWLGPLTADQIVAEMQHCAAVLLPTYVEGYCLALAEAMAVGVPTAVAYVGGAAHLARDGESALYFSPGDVEMAAYQVERLLVDRPLAERIGRQARQVALARNDPIQTFERQMDIYHRVLQSTQPSTNKLPVSSSSGMHAQ